MAGKHQTIVKLYQNLAFFKASAGC